MDKKFYVINIFSYKLLSYFYCSSEISKVKEIGFVQFGMLLDDIADISGDV